MYDIRAEHLTTEIGITLLWHVIGHDGGDALCGRVMVATGASVADKDVYTWERYCAPCLEAVAAAAASRPPARGRAEQETKGLAPGTPGRSRPQ